MSSFGEIGAFKLNEIYLGDSTELSNSLPDGSIDVLVTSPPYWGQRTSMGIGVEEDPRNYIDNLVNIFNIIKPKMKDTGIVWINIGDAYNTPVNWRKDDKVYSSLGQDKAGLSENNSAYTKNRAKRKAYVDKNVEWLKYGNLLALPYRMVIEMADLGWYYRGEVIWKKLNPMPEGRCRRPHRSHESIYLFSKDEKHYFKSVPPVKSVWEFGNEKISGKAHYSRFPLELPMRCIEAYGRVGEDIIVFDPFAGSGTTGLAALELGCSFIGFEIDPEQVEAANGRLKQLDSDLRLPLR